jgi:hypothetical protein
LVNLQYVERDEVDRLPIALLVTKGAREMTFEFQHHGHVLIGDDHFLHFDAQVGNRRVEVLRSQGGTLRSLGPAGGERMVNEARRD